MGNPWKPFLRLLRAVPHDRINSAVLLHCACATRLNAIHTFLIRIPNFSLSLNILNLFGVEPSIIIWKSLLCLTLLQACRQLNWIDGGGGGWEVTDVAVESRGVFICYISALIGKEVFAKIVQFDRYAVEKWGLGAPPGKIFVATPSITSETPLLQSRI